MDYLYLLLGIIFAGLGGELFVRGSVGIAQWLRVSPGIIGATVAAFATSSPETSVSITSALANKPQIALGDALGSNIVNVSLILGLALLYKPIQVPKGSMRRDFPIALIVPAITAVLFLDGALSRTDAFFLLATFSGWIWLIIQKARKERNETDSVLGEARHRFVIPLCIAGLFSLVLAGGLIVSGGRGIAASFGVPEFIIGATIVAIGTSVPELATTIIACVKGHEEIGLGTVLGSNIFNGLFVVGTAAAINPIEMPWLPLIASLAFGVICLVQAIPFKNGQIFREQGIILLASYLLYIFIVVRNQIH
jgi:cation:H+ antiporter